jgi:O-antigen/teichoic acid export membrane protein
MSESGSDDLKRTVKGTATNYLVALLEIGKFVFQILATRLFGKLAYGAYGFAWSIIDISNKIALVGLNSGIVRSVATARAKKDLEAELKTLGTAIRIVISSSFIVMVLLVLAPNAIADLFSFGMQQQIELSVITSLTPFVLFWSVTLVLVNATMATKTMRYNLLVRGITDPFLLLVCILLFGLLWPDGGGVAIALAQVTASAIVMLVAFWGFSRVFNIRQVFRYVFSKKIDGDLIRFTIPMGIVDLLNQAIYRVDIIMIGMFTGNFGLVANYFACTQLANTISSIRYAFDPILSPVVAETVVSKDYSRLSDNLKRMTRWVTLLGMPVFLVYLVFGDVMLGLWGESYREAHQALIILACAHLVNTILGLCQWLVVMSGRSKLDLFNNSLGFAANFVLNLWLIPIWGLLGAAVASLAGNIVFRALQTIQVGVIFRMHPFSVYWLKILVAAGISLAVQLGIRSFVDGVPGVMIFIGATVAGVLFYLATYFLLGAAPEDKQMFTKFIRKLSHRNQKQA